MVPIKTILLRAAPASMENFSATLNRKIRITARSHLGAKKPWNGKVGNVNHDLTVAAQKIGYVAGDHVVKDDGLYFPYAFTDKDALEIFEKNLHKGWSIGIKPTKVAPDGEVLEYEPHHISLILPGQNPVAPKSVVDAVSNFSQIDPRDVVGFSIVETDNMDPPTNPAPAPAPEAAPAPETTPATAAPAAEAAPAPVEAPAPAPAAPATEAAPAAPAAAAAEAPAPAPAPEVPRIAGFSEVDIFAMRDELAALKQRETGYLSELEQLRTFKSKTEGAEKESLIARLQPRAPQGVDLAAESLENLRKIAAFVPAEPAQFSQLPAPAPAPTPAPEAIAQGSGAKEHNKAPTSKDDENARRRARIEQMWARG